MDFVGCEVGIAWLLQAFKPCSCCPGLIKIYCMYRRLTVPVHVCLLTANTLTVKNKRKMNTGPESASSHSDTCAAEPTNSRSEGRLEKSTYTARTMLYRDFFGLLRVQAYFFTYHCNVKKRWIGRTLYDIFTTDFGRHSKTYVVRGVMISLLLNCGNLPFILPWTGKSTGERGVLCGIQEGTHERHKSDHLSR